MDIDFDLSNLQSTEENIFENNNVTLIDFGFSTSYLDK